MKCIDCANLVLKSEVFRPKKFPFVKNTKFYMFLKNKKLSPIETEIMYYYCLSKETYFHRNWKITKERKCKDFAAIKPRGGDKDEEAIKREFR